MKTIVLTGMMGAGKTTTGKKLADIFSCKFSDLDKIIEENEKMTIPEIFEKFGEEYFRKKELETLKKIFTPENMILSLGGGAFENKEIQNLLLNSSTVIYLETSPEVIFHRIKNDNTRPLLKDEMSVEKISQIINIRKKNYKLATHTVITDNKNTEEIVAEIVKCVC